MWYDWLLFNTLGNQGSQRRSKNNLRGITIGIGPIRGINSRVLHSLLARDILKSENLWMAQRIFTKIKKKKKNAPVLVSRGRISSLGRVLDCRAGGRGFDSRGRTNINGHKMTEKWRYCAPLPCKRLHLQLARMTMYSGAPVSSRRLKKYGPQLVMSC